MQRVIRKVTINDNFCSVPLNVEEWDYSRKWKKHIEVPHNLT